MNFEIKYLIYKNKYNQLKFNLLINAIQMGGAAAGGGGGGGMPSAQSGLAPGGGGELAPAGGGDDPKIPVSRWNINDKVSYSGDGWIIIKKWFESGNWNYLLEPYGFQESSQVNISVKESNLSSFSLGKLSVNGFNLLGRADEDNFVMINNDWYNLGLINDHPGGLRMFKGKNFKDITLENSTHWGRSTVLYYLRRIKVRNPELISFLDQKLSPEKLSEVLKQREKKK